MTIEKKTWVEPVAKAGLITKGLVYSLVGALAFMAAFEIAGRSNENADKKGVFNFIEEQTGGQIMLLIVALGLVCYSIWRGVQTFSNISDDKKSAKGLGKRARYLFSGFVYLSLAFVAAKVALHKSSDSSGSGSKQSMAAELLSKPYGQILAGIAALIIAGVGVYQLWYGWSGKYKKHVSDLKLNSDTAKVLVRSGKIGFMARGFVYLIIAYMFLQAAMQFNSSKAGDTAQAFQFLEDTSYGSYLLGAVGLGLICYGVFNFLRAKYDQLV